MTDLRYTCRSLLKKPGFTAVALLTLALGVGANTAIFSVLNGILLRPLPYADPDQLVQVWQTNPAWIESANAGLRSRWDRFPLSFPVYRDWREANPVFEHLGVFNDASYTWTGGDRPERITGAGMSSEAFAALGVEPVLGRAFSPDEDRIGGPALVVLSHGFWLRRLGSDTAVLGETLVLDDKPYMIVGVMPEGFYFPSGGQLWTTFNDQARGAPRGTQFLKGIARLKDGISLERAQHDMEAVAARVAEQHPKHPYGVRLVSRKAEVVGDVEGGLLLLLGAVGLVLLIACANVANLLLVRATERRRELAVRTALGAGRGRLLRLLLEESMMISLAGGALGVLLALTGLRTLRRWLPPGIPRLAEIGVDVRVLAFAVVVTLLTGLVVGLLPALGASRTNVAEALAEATRAGSRRRHRTQALLVVAEIALAFLLLTGASLLATSFARLTSVESGFETGQRLTMYVQLPWNGVPKEEMDTFYDQVTERLEAIPGVDRVAATDTLPFGGGSSSGTYTLEAGSEVLETNVERSVVTASYFEVLGIPLLLGRPFTTGDRPGGPGVVVVSEAMAQAYWPGESPVGRRLKKGNADSDRPWLEVVGVAGDVRHQGFDVPSRPKLYLPASQHEAPARTFVLKTSVEPSAVASAARNAVWDVDPRRPVQRLATLESVVSKTVARPRFRTLLITSLALLAALLAVVGIYGVMAYAVAQRTYEIGIRMALGARRHDVVRGVLVRALRMAGLGLALGLVLAGLTLRTLESFLFEVSAGDPKLLTAVALVLALAAVLASFVPARRAAGVDPAVALRD